MIRLFFTCWFALLLCQLSAQQTTLQGTVTDQQSKKAVAAASVNIKSSDGKVVAFKATNREGHFQMTINRSLEGLTLEINHLGYKKYMQGLHSADSLHIELENSTILLEDVEVKSRPAMRRMGDTLAYNVEAFAQEEDRSIGDVIARLPGMEVTESGQIKYQGKAISNFLIDGDDLLKDKYAIGNRTIPHDMVKDVQVMENHEQLKVMKGKRYSDDVAVNLIIKEDAKLKLTGQAKVGAGLPHQYDSEVNTILFNKKVKTLNALSGNNVGRDFTGEMVGFNQENSLARMGTSAINNLLSLGTVGAPPIAPSHYYFNNSVYLNSNYLINGKKDWQYKINLQTLYDQSTREFAGNTTFLNEQEDIYFDENQNSELKKFLTSLRLSANKNVDKKFVNNHLTLDYANERGTAAISSNDNSFDIRRNHQIWGFSNRLQYVPELKNKNVIEINWFMNYAEKPQEMILNPGIYPTLLHDGSAYQSTRQHVSVPQFFTNASTGYRLTKGLIKQSYSVGFSLENQHLQSHIDLVEEGAVVMPTADSTANDMQWLRSRTSLNAQYEWKSRRFQSRLSLPLTYQDTRFTDHEYQLDERKDQILFNPSFNMTHRVNREDELSANYMFSNNFGNIANVYRGMIVMNYRSISNNDSDIFETQSHNVSANYKLSRALKLLTANWGISYSKRNMNTIAAQIVSNNITQTVLVPMDNQTNNLSLSAGLDKYIFDWASTVKLQTSWSIADANQLFNEDLLRFQNRNFTLRPSIEAKIYKGFKFSYTASGSWFSTRQKDGLDHLDRDVFQASQNLGFPINLYKKVNLRFSARHLYTRQPGMEDINYLFFDTFARYRLSKPDIDLELNLTNLANIKRFETYSITSNMMTHNQYQLRGRMVVLKAVFNL